MISLSSANTQVMDTTAARQEIETRKADGTLWTMPAEERNKLYGAGYPGPQVRVGTTVRIDDSAPAAQATPPPGESPIPWPPTKEEMDRKHTWTLQAESEAELARLRQAMQAEGKPNPASYYLTPHGLEKARPPEPLDLTDIPAEDHDAVKVFHEATGGQAYTTTRWLQYAATHTPLGEDDAWAVLNDRYGQEAGRLVGDAKKAFDHPDFPASLRRFIERKQLENDAHTIAALAEWSRARAGK